MHRRWVVSPDYRSVIETLIQVRIDQGVSQRELGRRLGKPPSFPNKIENFERRLDVLEFIAIARALGIAPDELMGRLAKGLPEELAF